MSISSGDSPAVVATPSHERGEVALRLIAAYKLLATLSALIVAFELLHLVHEDLAEVVQSWVEALRIDPENPYVQKLIDELGFVDAKRLQVMSGMAFFYAALEMIEGLGLWFRKRWAEYFTIIATAAFLPLEIYELVERVNWPKVVVFVINIAVVVYLIYNLRQTRRTHAPA